MGTSFDRMREELINLLNYLDDYSPRIDAEDLVDAYLEIKSNNN